MALLVATLDPLAYLSAMTSAAAVLEDHATGLDHLALDGDPLAAGTDPPRGVGAGSDIATTLTAAVSAAGSCGDFATMCSAMSSAAQDAAHGRPGRSMARFLDGLTEVFRNTERIDAQRFALGLEAAAERLAPGDDGRHPGGFAAVANAAADAALDAADRGLDLAATVIAAAGSGVEELERGPALDARLAERGSVDGSAAGLLLVLDSLASVLTDEPLPEPPPVPSAADATLAEHGTTGVTREAGEMHRFSFGISCEVLPEDPGIEGASVLEHQLSSMSEIRRFEREPRQWIVEVVATNPGPVVELLAASGSLREVRIVLHPLGGDPEPRARSSVGAADRQDKSPQAPTR